MSEDPFGILVVNKRKDMTSHDVVEFVRRKFGVKKVGHAGTLDPNATGVLILLLGRATKLAKDFLNDDKEYIATMKLGERTSSGDTGGKIISSKEMSHTEKEITCAIKSFQGEIEQVPPMVSAKKVKGERLYKLARRGIEIKREPIKVLIKDLEITKMELPIVSFRVLCSKGTYIRQLADDIGEKIGCGAHLLELERIRSGRFSLDQAVAFSDLAKMDRTKFYENIIRI